MQYLDDVTGCFIAKIFVINQPVLSTVYRFPSNFEEERKSIKRRRHQIERRAKQSPGLECCNSKQLKDNIFPFSRWIKPYGDPGQGFPTSGGRLWRRS